VLKRARFVQPFDRTPTSDMIQVASRGNFLIIFDKNRREDFSFRSSTEFRKNCRKRTKINSYVD